jgi:hypothetical protein
MRYSGLILVLLVALTTTAACERAVRPFRPHDKSVDNPLLRLPTSVGLAIAPTVGATPAMREPLARALVAALDRLDISASVANPTADAIHVESQALVSNRSAMQASLIIHWNLSDPQESAAGSYKLEMPISAEEWVLGAPGLVKQIANTAAHGIATLIQADQREQIIAKAPNSLVTLAIAEIEGVPDNDSDILRVAFQTVLKQVGVLLVENSTLASATLRGSVNLISVGEGRTRLVIVWTLSSADGDELGTLSQDNTVAKAHLSERWANMVYDIAFAAADAITGILEQIDVSGVNHPIGGAGTAK